MQPSGQNKRRMKARKSSEHSLTQAVLAMLLGISAGTFISFVLIPGYGEFTKDNRVSIEFPFKVLPVFLTSIAAVFLCHLYFYRRRTSVGPLFEAAVNRKLLWLLAVPFFILLISGTGKEVRWLTLLSCLGASGFLTVGVIGGLNLIGSAEVFTRFPTITLTALCLFYTAIAGHISTSIASHLLVPSFDLATYHNILYQHLYGGFLQSNFQPGGSHLSSHFDPFLLLLTLPYFLFKNVEFLLYFQSFWLSLSIFPLYGLAKLNGSGVGGSIALTICFLLHPALHGMNFYEFHSLVFATPLLLLLIYALQKHSYILCWSTLLLLLTVREDVSLLVIAISFYFYFRGTTGKIVTSTILIAGTYLIICKFFFMPDSGLIMERGSNSISFREEFKELIPFENQGAIDALVTVITNPVYALSLILREEVIFYYSLLLSPLLFLPLFAPGWYLLLAYGILFSGLSSNRLMHSVFAQYSTFLLPLVFALLPSGVERAVSFLPDPERQRSRLMAVCLITSLLVSAGFGGIIPNKHFRIAGTFRPPHFSDDPTLKQRYEDGEAARHLFRLVPENASICATRFIAPLIAHHRQIQLYHPQKVCDYYLLRLPTLEETDKIVINQQRKMGIIKEIRGTSRVILYQRLADQKPAK